ncbi:MAG: hypothetical protein IJ328_07830, partial [Muribaculaceae bacterium]|nr:hypothetical protein [Muribaculaceae bacterium]
LTPKPHPLVLHSSLCFLSFVYRNYFNALFFLSLPPEETLSQLLRLSRFPQKASAKLIPFSEIQNNAKKIIRRKTGFSRSTPYRSEG